MAPVTTFKPGAADCRCSHEREIRLGGCSPDAREVLGLIARVERVEKLAVANARIDHRLECSLTKGALRGRETSDEHNIWWFRRSSV